MFQKTRSVLLLMIMLAVSFNYGASRNFVFKQGASEEKIVAPDGISMPAAFMALYNAAIPSEEGVAHPLAQRVLRDKKHAMQVFLTQCKRARCGEIDGRIVGIDFERFPRLDVAQYNREHGQNAAQRTLHGAIMSLRGGSGYFSKDACTYFEGVPREQVDQDLLSAFKQCRLLKKGEKQVAGFQDKLSQNAPEVGNFKLFSRCVASYTIQSDVGSCSHTHLSCDVALGHMRSLKEPIGFDDSYRTWLKKLSLTKIVSDVGMFGREAPSAEVVNSSDGRSVSVSFDHVSLSVAIQALESAMDNGQDDE